MVLFSIQKSKDHFLITAHAVQPFVLLIVREIFLHIIGKLNKKRVFVINTQNTH